MMRWHDQAKPSYSALKVWLNVIFVVGLRLKFQMLFKYIKPLQTRKFLKPDFKLLFTRGFELILSAWIMFLSLKRRCEREGLEVNPRKKCNIIATESAKWEREVQYFLDYFLPNSQILHFEGGGKIRRISPTHIRLNFNQKIVFNFLCFVTCIKLDVSHAIDAANFELFSFNSILLGWSSNKCTFLMLSGNKFDIWNKIVDLNTLLE